AISRHIRSSTSLARGVRSRLSKRDSASVIGFHDTSRCCAGGFAKLVARDVEKGEAPTLLWERLKIRLDENLDRLFHWNESRHERAHRQSQLRSVVRSFLE